jgi:exportin-1
VVLQPLSELLADYKESPPELREADVLILFSRAFEKLGVNINEMVPQIICVVFDATIGMISADFNSYPDHRQYFFEFIKTSVTHEFGALFNMPAD